MVVTDKYSLEGVIMMITFQQKGDFKKINSFLEKSKEGVRIGILNKYGRLGVEALSSVTPVDTGLTAASWYYKITRSSNNIVTLTFNNSNIQNGTPIAIVLQYGHGTIDGGWVDGRDYINPAVQPVFDQLAKEAWKEVTK